MTTTGQYLMQRVRQLDIGSVFGVPGDFNLTFLDDVVATPGIQWIGCCNELNAAYAADGYARLTRKLGVLVTTFGVGELSALNGVAGARAETIPLLHIVGTTGRAIAADGVFVHHVAPAEDLDHKVDHFAYQRASQPFSCASEYLQDPSQVAQQIDRVIETVCKRRRPGYVFLPVDMVAKPVPEGDARLQKPLDLAITSSASPEQEDAFVEAALNEIYAARNPIILADSLVDRYDALDEARQLFSRTQFWGLTTSVGKGILDETADNYVGVYNGVGSNDGIVDLVESQADLVLNLGAMLQSSNSAGFSRALDDSKVIFFDPFHCTIRGRQFRGVHLLPALRKLLARLDTKRLPPPQPHGPIGGPKVVTNGLAPLAHAHFITSITKILECDDVVFVDSGDSQFACADIALKHNGRMHHQIVWSSIGYALPAVFGAEVARREKNLAGKTVLIEGDGASQMTVQELASMMRHGQAPVIFLVNNNGYSIERAIHGPDQVYNDICPNWQWPRLLEGFGGVAGKQFDAHQVRSNAELDALFGSASFRSSLGVRLQFVEVYTHRDDHPWRVAPQVASVFAFNKRLGEEYERRQGST